MIKNILGLLLGVMVLQSAQAQKNTIQKDTLLYYVKNSGEITLNKDSADYFMFIMPLDASSGKKLYPIDEFYRNGGRKLITASATNVFERLKYDGPFMSYYLNGKRNTSATFVDGVINGDLTKYYPNGKLYCIENHKAKNALLVECRDSLGKVLAENGNGHWLEFDDQFKKIISEGNVSDGLKDGEWHGNTDDTGRYTCLYNKGILISGTGYNKSNTAYPFNMAETAPAYKGGILDFKRFVQSKMVFPEKIKNHSTKGTLYLYDITFKFNIKQDGSLVDLVFIKPPAAIMRDSVINAIKSSPKWKPGYMYGLPAEKEVTVTMTLVDSNNPQ